MRVATARAAVEELLDGRPIYPGSTRPFPAGTRLLGLRVRAGTATVDLSRQALGGRPGGGYGQCSVQALVWTLTGVRGVRRVLLEVEGRTSGWIDGHDLASAWGGRNRPGRRLAPDRGARVAPIVLTGPLPGGLVSGDRIVVTGDASVRDGTVGLRLRDQQGAVVAQTVSTAALPAPARGAFAGALVFPPPPRPERWTVEAFAASPTDGSVLYAVTVPVTVAAPARSPATGTPAAGTPPAPATSTSVAPG